MSENHFFLGAKQALAKSASRNVQNSSVSCSVQSASVETGNSASA